MTNEETIKYFQEVLQNLGKFIENRDYAYACGWTEARITYFLKKIEKGDK